MNPQDLPKTIVSRSPRPPPGHIDPEAQAQRFIGWVRLWLPWAYHLQATFTNNRSTLISYRRDNKMICLRLHRLFAQAGPDVAQAVGHYVAGKKAHVEPLKAYIATIEGQVVQAAMKGSALSASGVVHELQPLHDALNASHFDGRCTSAIVWGRAAARRGRRRSVVLGSYAPAQNLIRLHPCLDQPFVPAYVVRGVVHHEMLHEVLGVQQVRGRRRIHPPEFVAIEKMFEDYARCTAWEQANIGRLLAYNP
jgi:hypothetical protein